LHIQPFNAYRFYTKYVICGIGIGIGIDIGSVLVLVSVALAVSF